ncbi:MAG: hypothetical protein CMJ74_13635 [Planctomycetaceae bacterium]|nr:hypothetical protein [Planctomycetaceae bacterium]
MATVIQETQATPGWATQIAQLRRRIRSHILFQGLAIFCITLTVGFWFSFAVDWLWEPTVGIRIALMSICVPISFWVVWRFSLNRLRVPLPDASMALLLERRFPVLRERLLTIVQLTGTGEENRDFDPQLLEYVSHELEPLFPLSDSQRILNTRPLIRSFTAAVLLALSILLFYFLHSGLVQIWAARNLTFQDLRWPRATQIRVEGFVAGEDGVRRKKVARGGEVSLTVQADLAYELPQRVEIIFTTADGRSRSIGMTRLKAAIPGRDSDQEYSYVFKNVRASTPLSIVAHSGRLFSKPDRIDGLRIDAVQSPALVDIQLHYKFPDYLKMPSATGSIRLNAPIPRGTQVRVVGRSNKPLSAAMLRRTELGGEAVDQQIPIDTGNAETIDVDLSSVNGDTQLDFRLFDSDQIKNVEPVRLVLRTIEDMLPEVDVGPAGIGKSITPVAIIPLQGGVRDDHGVAETRVAYTVDGGEDAFLPVTLPESGSWSAEDPYAFEVESLQLQPGQAISLQLQARDFCDLRDVLTYGKGAKYNLKIVTESQLRAELESREKILRRRMETIFSEAQRMEDSLARLGAVSVGVGPTRRETDIDRKDSIRMVRIESALDSADRMRNETANVGLEFERILIELRNNRVAFLGELEQRIGGRIVDPLRNITTEFFPDLEKSLQQLRESIADAESFSTSLSTARKNVRLILQQMKQVLENMLKLQQFNEVLADLRKIIDAQQRVSRQTLEQRKRLEQQLKDQLKKDLLE